VKQDTQNTQQIFKANHLQNKNNPVRQPTCF